MNNSNLYIDYAILEAKKALKINEVPIGAIIVKNGKIIGKGYNKKEKNNCSLEHAELIAIRNASKKLKNWRLEGCEIYITLEPCPMCISAIKQSRISKVYYGTSSLNNKNTDILVDIINDNFSNTDKIDCVNLNNETCAKLISDFFKEKREK